MRNIENSPKITEQDLLNLPPEANGVEFHDQTPRPLKVQTLYNLPTDGSAACVQIRDGDDTLIGEYFPPFPPAVAALVSLANK